MDRYLSLAKAPIAVGTRLSGAGQELVFSQRIIPLSAASLNFFNLFRAESVPDARFSVEPCCLTEIVVCLHSNLSSVLALLNIITISCVRKKAFKEKPALEKTIMPGIFGKQAGREASSEVWLYV